MCLLRPPPDKISTRCGTDRTPIIAPHPSPQLRCHWTPPLWGLIQRPRPKSSLFKALLLDPIITLHTVTPLKSSPLPSCVADRSSRHSTPQTLSLPQIHSLPSGGVLSTPSIIAPDLAAPANNSAPHLRADRQPQGSTSPGPSRRRPGALTSKPRPPRVRGREREGGRARMGGSVRAPVPARPAQPGIPGREGGWGRAQFRPRAAELRWGRGLSPGPPRAGVGSGGGAARRPDQGRAAAASPQPAAAAAATRASATSVPRPSANPPHRQRGRSRTKRGPES